MGQLDESRSASKMAKSTSAVKKSSSSKGKKGQSSDLSFSDPKVQGVLLVGLLAVLALALWFGFTHGCLRRRRRRRSSCC